ncbi:hypothetical protein CDD82_4626 [Ophiocordyceps australis]|uniref:Nucleoside diphosphate kinase n=1 Tax=Ophiocordyceps australis TaxID=1399860 RepID=A0A2C5Z1X6_9HYPO|nr:hypothetical protein CDD82_4626 [Ophiocordyceps australis]
MSNEQTFIAVKPDGVQRGLVGAIISRFENRGFKLVALKFFNPPESLIKKHYEDLATKPFYNNLVKFISQGPVCAMVWEGRDVVLTGRTMLGATDPLKSAPGTIRGDYAIDMGRNVCHGSDSVATAKREIGLWFQPEEVIQWQPLVKGMVYE